MTVHEALVHGAKKLKRHRCRGASPARESEELLAWATRSPREAFFSHPERVLTARETARFEDALDRRLLHEPVEYLTGRAGFMGMNFAVTKDTLIPRQATEFVVEAALVAAKDVGDPLFIDVGTGSGCIACTIAMRRPDARVIATDTAPKALRAARRNARLLGLDGRVHFAAADLLPHTLPGSETTIVIANLPYIPTAMIRRLPAEVRRYEPRSALDGGKDGLDACRALLGRLATTETHGRIFLFFEVLPGEFRPLAAAVRRLFPDARPARLRDPRGTTIGLSARARK